MLTQVAGRAGRGDVEGGVIVQAFTPFHPAIQYARRHDFAGFYEQEIEFREQLQYPPITRVALLTLKGRNQEKVKFSAEHVRKELDKLAGLGSQKVGKRESESAEPVRSGAMSAHFPTFPLSQLPAFHALPGLIIAGPAPAPLLRAETYYRYQIMLRTRQMSRLSRSLAKLMETLALPEDVSLTVDVDPVDLT